MKLSDFDFDLPPELIAQHPTTERSGSRLLHLDKANGIQHRQFTDFIDLVNPNDLLVFNNTKVIPARLFGHKTSGGAVEVLVERITSERSAWAHIRANKSSKTGTILTMEGGIQLEITGRDDNLFSIRCLNEQPLVNLLEQHGHMPLPPYLKRSDQTLDRDRYQTVYAKHQGAVAAPTAGLHFDQALLNKLADKGIATAEVTLHVGAGTFQPVKTERIEQHQMHAEWVEVSQTTVDAIAKTRQNGGRIIAIGTTSVRSLETAAQNGLQAYQGDTRIFIYPGYQFKVVDALLTNFHLPKSTLIMLVSTLAGREAIMNAYQAAVKERYRFFSYGDAMLISN